MSCVNILDNDLTLVSPATFGEDFACATGTSNHDVLVTATLRFKPNGTWEVLRSPTGGTSSGSWHIGAPANPSDFEVRITGNIQKITTTPGCPDEPPYEETNTPVDTGWLQLNVNRQQVVSAFAHANVLCPEQHEDSTFEFTVQIRQISNHSNTVTDSGSMCAQADAVSL